MSSQQQPFPSLGKLRATRRCVSEGSSSVRTGASLFVDGSLASSGTRTDDGGRSDDRAPARQPDESLVPSPPSLDPRVVKERYVLGEMLPGGETETIEFKSCLERYTQTNDKNSTDINTDLAAKIVKSKIGRYIVAFLNSSGGAILFGVEDDGKVSGCLLTEAQRTEITKTLDVTVNGIDPQVEVGTVWHRFTPVLEAGQELEATAVTRYVIIVAVRPPESSRLRQPAYYPTKCTLESYIRRAESVYYLTAALVQQREDEFRAAGRSVQRTWRHVVRNNIDFDGHIESLRSTGSSSGVAAVPRIKLIASLAAAVLDGEESPSSRIVAVVGESGTGKSTLIASLIAGGRNKQKESGEEGWKNLAVCGWYFCGAPAVEEASASAFVGHVAASLTMSHHTRAFRRFVQDDATDILKTIESADPRTAFRGLLRICHSLVEQPTRRLVFFVDAIDEAIVVPNLGSENTGSSRSTSIDLLTISDLIFGFASEAPPWLVFVVTSRSRANIPPNVVVVRADEGAVDDIAALIAKRREQDPILKASLTEEVARHLAEAAGSNFQFVHSVTELVGGHGWGSNELSVLLPAASVDKDVDENCSDRQSPDDAKLHNLYGALIRLQFSRLQLRHVLCVLELLVAARRPLTGSDITTALHLEVPAEDVRSSLRELMAYLSTDMNRCQSDNVAASSVGIDAFPVHLNHLSFRQWLLDSRNTLVPCNMARGHARLAMYHLNQAHLLSTTSFLRERFPTSDSETNLDQEGIHHVLEAAIHLGQMSTAPNTDIGIIATLRDLSGKYIVAADSVGRSAIHFATRQAKKIEYLVALNLLLAASSARCPSMPIEAGLQGKCPLVIAAQRGYDDAFALLVRYVDSAVQARTIEPDDAEEALEEALWSAASAGAVGCVKLLVGVGPDLSVALQRGLLMGPVDVSNREKPCPIVDSLGRTALWLAVAADNLEAVTALVTNPPKLESSIISYMDIGIQDPSCEVPASPLHLAVSQGNAEIVRLLAGHTNPGLVGQIKGERWPMPPLCSACILGDIACVKELLQFPNGSDLINLASGFPPHRTPLLEAVWNVRIDCVRLLLEDPSTDVLLAEDDGSAALHEACYWGKGRHKPMASHADATTILKMILAHHSRNKLSLDIPDADGCTPLCFAAAADCDQAEWVELLLKAGASPHIKPRGGAKVRGLYVARAHGPGLTAQPWGGTPLEEAATRNNVNAVATICAAGVDRIESAPGFGGQAKALCASIDHESSKIPLFDSHALTKVGGSALANAFNESNALVVSGTPRFAARKDERAPTSSDL